MAEKKEPVERKFVKASDAKEEAPKRAPKKDAPTREAEETVARAADDEEEEKPRKKKEQNFVEVDHSGSGKTRPERAMGFRVAAWILWIVGIGFEVLAILMLNKTMYVPADKFTLFFFGALAIDLVAVIIASQCWKKANHIDPASEKNKAKFILHNNLGVVMSIIAFLPIVILLLRNKDLDPKMKKIASIVAAAALVLASVCSIDFNPVSQEQLAEAKQDVSEITTDGTVYWTQFGKSYHCDPDCHTIANSKNVYYGTIEEAFEAKRSDPCDYCALDKASGETLLEEPAA